MTEWEWEKIAEHDSLTEGPVWDGSGLLYNECSANTTYRWDPNSKTSVIWRTNTGAANGMTFDHNGQLWVCEGDKHRVTRIDLDNPNSEPPNVIINKLEDKSINWPNDIAVTSQGRVYFTDPNYSTEPNNLPHESVYMSEHSFGGAWSTTRVTFDTARPNGVLLSQDEKTLFVAESPSSPNENRQLRSYPILSNGLLDDYQVLFDFGLFRGIDGMTLTTDGIILATAGDNNSGPGPMIYEIEQNGLVRSTHKTPKDAPTNCTFGGSSLDTLFVTFATGHLFSVSGSSLTGHLLYPSRRF